jgi:hypothetical protein
VDLIGIESMTSSMPWNESNRDYRHSTSGSVESAKPAQSALFATKMRQQRAIRQSLWDQPASSYPATKQRDGKSRAILGKNGRTQGGGQACLGSLPSKKSDLSQCRNSLFRRFCGRRPARVRSVRVDIRISRISFNLMDIFDPPR